MYSGYPAIEQALSLLRVQLPILLTTKGYLHFLKSLKQATKSKLFIYFCCSLLYNRCTLPSLSRLRFQVAALDTATSALPHIPPLLPLPRSPVIMTSAKSKFNVLVKCLTMHFFTCRYAALCACFSLCRCRELW